MLSFRPIMREQSDGAESFLPIAREQSDGVKSFRPIMEEESDPVFGWHGFSYAGRAVKMHENRLVKAPSAEHWFSGFEWSAACGSAGS